MSRFLEMKVWKSERKKEAVLDVFGCPRVSDDFLGYLRMSELSSSEEYLRKS